MRSTPIPCATLLFEMCSYCVVFSIGKRGRTDRLFGKGCVLQCARNLHTAVCHAGEIREYHMKDTGTGSEVLYRWGGKQRMLVEDDLGINPKKQYRYSVNLHTAK